MLKAVRILIAAFAMASLAVAPAAAQSSTTTTLACTDSGPVGAQYPPRCPAPQAENTQVEAGGSVRVTGQCPVPNSSVRFVLRPGDTALATATTSATGAYDVQVPIPSNTAPGNYQIVVICSTGPERTVNVQVLGAGQTRATTTTTAAVGAGALPRTGTETITMAAGGAVLVGLGAAAVIATRRRRQPTA